MNKWFITGTDTEVGKTVASCALLQAAVSAGYHAVGYKPVASGSQITAEGIRNDDALALQRESALKLPYEAINPLVFIESTSPHIISAHEQRPIHFSVMSEGLARLTAQSDWVQVEGAGGWLTPLSDTTTFADWVKTEHLPVILVVGIKLGCINHALLTVRVIQDAGLSLAGWIANDIQPQGKWHSEYLATLEQRISAPLLGEIPWFEDLTAATNLGDYLNLEPLRLSSNRD